MITHDDIFPITLPCSDVHYVTYDRSFLPLFRSIIPEDEHWYAYDVIITAKDKVTFVAYEMFSNVSGGIGRVFGRYDADCLTTLTKPHINKKIIQLATEQRARELQTAEDAIIKSYARMIHASNKL